MVYLFGRIKYKLKSFLPMPLAGAWVNRLTFSSSLSLPSHLKTFLFLPGRKKLKFVFLPVREKLKFFVSLKYRQRHGGAWVFGCVCHLVFTTGLAMLKGLECEECRYFSHCLPR